MNPNIPKLIAHRGGLAYAPENTLTAFKSAKYLGALMIEFDVSITKDGCNVVFHDDKINRTTNGRGLLNTKTLTELQELDAGSWFSRKFKGEKIPTFVEVLKLLNQLKINANIEIKPLKENHNQTVAQILAELNEHWPIDIDDPILSSFDYKVLETIRSYSPDYQLGFLMHSWDNDWLSKAKKLDCYSIHANYKILNAKRIDEIKKEGYLLLSYTVNRAKKALKLLTLGVDGIFTDYPDLLK